MDSKNLGKGNVGVVYDISLDGTVVNALGMNVMSNTDGFNFVLPKVYRYTDEHPYVSNGRGIHSKEGKTYTGPEADMAEFEDTLLTSDTVREGGLHRIACDIDEYIDGSVNLGRKLYADLLPNGKVKLVGNALISRSMPGYLRKFVDKGVLLILHGKGQEFIDWYYECLDNIYNYRIPVKDIASKGKIKVTLDEYTKNLKVPTKSGAKRSRQAWYEIAIRENLKVNMGDTVAYINTGEKKNDGDVKRKEVTYVMLDGNEVELKGKVWKKLIEPVCLSMGKTYKGLSKDEKEEIVKPFVTRKEEIVTLNACYIPSSIMDSEKDIMCSELDGIEYNVAKYIESFNNKARMFLVCFSPDIRDEILISNPDDRKYFTEQQCQFVSGYPTKEGMQDTYEALMTPERKEIEFWDRIGEVPPFVKECRMDWDKLVADYRKLKEEEDTEMFRIEDEKYLKALDSITVAEVKAFEEDGVIPAKVANVVQMGSDMHFYFINIPDKRPSTGGYIFDDIQVTANTVEEDGE